MRSWLAIGIAGMAVSACSSDDPAGFCGDGVRENGVEACDDGNDASGDGCSPSCEFEAVTRRKIAAQWSFRTLPSGAADCPAGFPTVRLVAQPIDASDAPAGGAVVTALACADGMGVGEHAVGRYQASIEVAEGPGDAAAVYARSLPEVVDLTSNDGALVAELITNGGYFRVAWQLRGATSGAQLTCAQAGAAKIQVTAKRVGQVQGVAEKFDCVDGAAVTAPLAAGAYGTVLKAFDDALPAVERGASVEVPGDIAERNAVTDLATVTISVSGL